MNWPAVMSGAAVRVLRGVAGRRALHVALLVGGVFALGLLYGERAQAAEAVTVATAVTESPGVSSVAPDEKPSASASADSGMSAEGAGTDAPSTIPAAPSDAIPAALSDVMASAPRVVGLPPTEDLAEGLGEEGGPLGGGLGEGLGEVSQDVTRSVASAGLPAVLSPVRMLPALFASIPQATVGPGAPVGVGGDEHRIGAAASVAQYGPRLIAAAPVRCAWGAWATSSCVYASELAATAQVPRTTFPAEPRVPGGGADGVLGSCVGADAGGSRSGDAYAVTPAFRVPLRLVAGAAAGVDAAGTRDRYRDIPVFPA